MEKHIEDNMQKHLALMASVSMKLSQEFEKKLQEQRNEFWGYLEQKDRRIEHIQETLQEEKDKVLNEKQQQIEALKEQILQIKQDHEERIKAVEQQREEEEQQHQEKLQQIEEQIVQVKEDHEERIKVVEQKREEQRKSLTVQSQQHVKRIGKLEKQPKEKEQELEQLNMKSGMPPFHFIMYDFNQLKSKDTSWHSSPMYTHPHSYKFCITVYPNGWFCGDVGSHVSVYLWVWCHSPVAGKSHHHFTAPQSAQRQWPHHRDKNSFFGRDQRGRESICRC